MIRKKSLAEIRASHGLSERSCRRYLQALEKIGILDRLPQGRIRIRLREPIGFPKSGKLIQVVQEKFARSLMNRVLSDAGSPAGADPKLHTREWMLSPENAAQLRRELEAFMQRFDQLSARDHAVLAHGQQVPVSMAIGLLFSGSAYGKIPEL